MALMTASRRTWFGQAARAAGKAAGFGGAMAIGHVLLGDRPRRYPAIAGGVRSPDVRLIRPPGTLDERAFLAGCIRCYRCQDACDIGAIQFFSEADGKLYHTPYVDPAVKACNLCMKCTKACPTGVLAPMEPEDKQKVRMASVELRTDLCLSYKAKRIRDEQALPTEPGQEPTEATADVEGRGPCGECYMFCPVRERAITLEPGAFLAPVIHEEHCVGCGLCEEICRTMVRGEPAIRVMPTRERT